MAEALAAQAASAALAQSAVTSALAELAGFDEPEDVAPTPGDPGAALDLSPSQLMALSSVRTLLEMLPCAGRDGPASLSPAFLSTQFQKHQLDALGQLFARAAAAVPSVDDASKPSLWITKTKAIRLSLNLNRAVQALKTGTRVAPTSLVVFGSIAMDLSAHMTVFPHVNYNTPAEKFVPRPGGKGCNEAVSASRLGINTYFIGRIGQDEFGQIMIQQLRKNKVLTDFVTVDPVVGTGVAMVIVSKDRKATIPCLGANSYVGSAEIDSLSRILDKHGPSLAMLLLQLEIPLAVNITVAAMARKKGLKVALKASPMKSAADVPPELMDNLDIIFLNEFEAPLLLEWSDRLPLKTLAQCHEAADEIKSRFEMDTIVIVSAFGCVCHFNKNGTHRRITIPFLLVEVVDIIGAADAFCGGFVAAKLWGRSTAHAMVSAACCGALSTQANGAQQSMPPRLVLRRFFNSRGIYVDEGLQKTPWPQPAPEPGTGEQLEHFVLVPRDFEMLRQLLALPGVADDARAHRDFQGQSLLHIAVICCNLNAVVILLSIGIDSLARDRYGMRAIDRAHELCLRTRDANLKQIIQNICSILTTDLWLNYCTRMPVRTKKPPKYSWSDFGVEDPDDLERLHHRLLQALFTREQPQVQQAVGNALVMFLQETADTQLGWPVLLARTDDNGLHLLHGAAFSGNIELVTSLAASISSLKVLCKRRRSALHYAVESGHLDLCRTLMEWHLDIFEADEKGIKPLDLACDECFRTQLETAGQLRNVFISYGHETQITSFVTGLERDLKANNITSWLDFFIPGGASWQCEIEKAIRRTYVLVLILSKKWISSMWCLAEYNMSRELHKPVICIIPPIDPANVVTVEDLPENMQQLRQNQWFDFRDCDNYEETLRQLCEQVPNVVQTANRSLARQLSSRSMSASRETSANIMRHHSFRANGASYSGPDVPNFVAIATGCDEDPHGGGFAEMLLASLQQEAPDVSHVVIRPYFDRKSILEVLQSPSCRAVVLIVNHNSNVQFFRVLLEEVSKQQKPVLIAPYAAYSSHTDGTVYLTFCNKIINTVYFMDWLGAGSDFCNSETYAHSLKRLLQDIRATLADEPSP
eukprot:m.67957 g.67957  ORF g.67957 m.67957 type:complete len:1099 (-) comp7705_c0_seq1:155-3451(-)